MKPVAITSRVHLLFRLSALGDIVLCSALVHDLQKHWPLEKIIFVTREEFADLVRTSFPKSVEVVSLKRPPLGLLGWLYTGWKKCVELAVPGTEVRLYDLHSVPKSWAFCAGAQLASWIKSRSLRILRVPKYSFLRWASIIAGRDFIGPRHVFREQLKLAPLATTHTAPSTSTPILRVDSSSPALNTNRILIAPDASHWKKKWPADAWEKFLHLALAHPAHVTVTLVGSTRCLPQDLRDDLESKYGTRLQNLLGKTKLVELPSIAARHAVTVCGNSAWLHISEAVGTPVVSLAGPIVPGFGFSPWMTDSRELSVELDCRPCTRHGGGVCRKIGKEFHACMRFISAEQVWKSVQERLSL